MTLEKVKLVDFTAKELKAVSLGLELVTVLAVTLTEEEKESIDLFKVQVENAYVQRVREEKIAAN
jgi:hypothetical protein